MKHLKFSYKVLARILIEFGPPLLLAIGWVRFAPPSESGPLGFSIVFFGASWFWGQFLRICYQQSQLGRFADLGGNLAAIKSTMGTIMASIAQLETKNLPDIKPEILHLSSLAGTANNQINAANTAFEAAKSYVLHAGTGRFKITSGSE